MHKSSGARPKSGGIISSVWNFVPSLWSSLRRRSSHRGQRPQSAIVESSTRFDVKPKMKKCKKTDTNVIMVSLGALEDTVKIGTGDPIMCTKCQAVLSCMSKTEQEGEKLHWKWYDLIIFIYLFLERCCQFQSTIKSLIFFVFRFSSFVSV